jgi:hypothetical protein
MEWTTIGQPGFAGNQRDEKRRAYDLQYGEENWRIMWRWGEDHIPFLGACRIYEDSYFVDSHHREDVWLRLIITARNIYDHEPNDVKSGLDYLIQQSDSTHLQDIAIRSVVMRRGWRFSGNELVQVRSHKTEWGRLFSPGKVLFHMPERIGVPRLKSWWGDGTTEQWYQEAKELQIPTELYQKIMKL